MKKINRALPVATLLASAVFLPMQAQGQVGVDVTIDMPSIAILNYQETVEVDLTAAGFNNLIGGGTAAGDAQAFQEGAASGAASATGGQFVLDGGITINQPTTDFSSLSLLMQNVWAVRAVHDNNVEVVAGPGDEQTLSNSGSVIETSNPTVPQGPFPAPGLGDGNAVFGDVVMNLDLSNTTAPGIHDGGGDSTYTLEVDLL